MATIRAYTTIEQSKKLAEILPLESADMCYPPYYIGDEEGDHLYYSKPINEIKDTCSRGKINKNEYIPCWSLSALLGVLPLVDFTMPKLIGTPKTLYRCIYNDGLMSHAYDNPVDACYEMILKLYELNLL